MDTKLVYTSDQDGPNWFYDKYYCCGGNSRYFTFQLALNLLSQKTTTPTIIETGCQRQADDLGAGMSTSIFGEYVKRYGGKLITVDLFPQHLEVCKECTKEFSDHISYIESDSLRFLSTYMGPCNLLYLDSLDYPVGTDAGNVAMQQAAQQHNLLEFKAIEKRLSDWCIILLDDNTLPGGGKPKLCKEYLITRGYTCLLDYQQSLFVKCI